MSGSTTSNPVSRTRTRTSNASIEATAKRCSIRISSRASHRCEISVGHGCSAITKNVPTNRWGICNLSFGDETDHRCRPVALVTKVRGIAVIVKTAVTRCECMLRKFRRRFVSFPMKDDLPEIHRQIRIQCGYYHYRTGLNYFAFSKVPERIHSSALRCSCFLDTNVR